jgi:hypothetical protein
MGRSTGWTSARWSEPARVHTATVIGVGLVVLAACLVVGRAVGGPAALPTAALVFLPLWFLGAVVNMAVGVKRAGYTLAEEAPVFLVVFAVPALLALFLRWRLH